MQELLDKLYFYTAQYGLKILAAAIIFFVGKWLAGVISTTTENMLLKTKVEKTLASFVKNICYVAVLVFTVIAALSKLGVETTSFIAILGAAGLAVGLSLQGSLSNFAAGVLIIIFRPFKVGDFIQAGGTMGTVTEIQIFTTILSAPDNRKEIVPNSQITGGNITNFSAIENRRIDLKFSISYSDDIKTAKGILEKVVSSDPRILKDPKPVIAVSELADSGVILICRPWVAPTDYWDVYFDTLEKGKIELEKNGITIPFPQTDVHLYQKNQ